MVHDPAEIRRAARLFKILSHPARLEIACRLAAEGARTQKQLIDVLGWPQSTMARHVAPLREVGLVEGQRRGTEVRLTILSPIVRTLVQTACDWMHEEKDRDPAPGAARGSGQGTKPEVQA